MTWAFICLLWQKVTFKNWVWLHFVFQMKKKRKEKGFTIWGPAPVCVCDLHVIQIFSSGCWLHGHYGTMQFVFVRVKYTIQQKTINEHVGSDAELKRALPDWVASSFDGGHLSVMARGKT